MSPPPEILWAAFLATCGAVIGWAFQQIIAARVAARQLTDHIEECDKRQIYIMKILTLIAEKVGVPTTLHKAPDEI